MVPPPLANAIPSLVQYYPLNFLTHLMLPSPPLSQTLLQSRWLLPVAVAGAVGAGWLAGKAGPVVPGLLVALPLLAFFLIAVFTTPRTGFVAFIVYCFVIMGLGRQFDGIQPGLAIDGLLVLTWLAVIFSRSPEIRWSRVQNDLCRLAGAWFIINILEIANPAGSSLTGWLYEMRGTTFYWFLSVPLGCMVFYKPQDLRLFLRIVIIFSALGALYGIKQKVFGVNTAEQRWLDSGAAITHVLWGRLRVFSFYSEAAQFGASQAHVGLICLILALGPFAWWKRVLMALTSLLLLYGMLISGTRGALFVVVAGLFIYLVINKNIKALVIGCVLALGALFVLKYTSIGSGSADIVRLRTSLDPNDASLQQRLMNQAKLREYLSSRPLGGGVGVIGIWGTLYNKDKYLSSIAPDSYFVKVWAEYGIIGFLIWFGMMLYILGKSCGIVWNIRDPLLRQKLLALTAGFGGILVSSYGNEVMNQMPSAMIVYVSWVFVFLGPTLDTPQLAPATHE
jgi:O-antigen ligase